MFKVLLLMFFIVPFVSDADIVWNFDNDVEGWQIADFQSNGPYSVPLAYYSLTHIATGGTPAGYVRGDDPSVNTYSFCMPVSVFECVQTFLDGNISFYLRTNGTGWPHEPFLILVCETEVLISAFTLPTTDWQYYYIDFSLENFYLYGGGELTEPYFENLMQTVENIYIVAEYGSPVYEHTDLDTVILSGLTYIPLASPDVRIDDFDEVSEEITLSWDAVPNAGGYIVYELDSPYDAPVFEQSISDTTITLPVTAEKDSIM